MSSAERKPSSNEALRRRLLDQHGVITAGQAGELGIPASALTRRVAGGELVRVHPGVYRAALVSPTDVVRAWCAVLWAGNGALLSHSTAARLRGVEVRDERVHLWVPAARRISTAGVVVHRGGVDDVDRRMVGGLPVTSMARTVIDLAAILERAALEHVLDQVCTAD